MIFVLMAADFAENDSAVFFSEDFREVPYSGAAVCPVRTGCGACFVLPQISPP